MMERAAVNVTDDNGAKTQNACDRGHSSHHLISLHSPAQPSLALSYRPQCSPRLLRNHVHLPGAA